MIHHLAFRTRDIERLERFYRDVIGLSVQKKDDHSTWLSSADGVLLMLERRADDEPEIPPGSMDLTCFAIAAEEAPTVRARLASLSVAIDGSTSFSIYIRDPDGRRIGLSAYPTPLS